MSLRARLADRLVHGDYRDVCQERDELLQKVSRLSLELAQCRENVIPVTEEHRETLRASIRRILTDEFDRHEDVGKRRRGVVDVPLPDELPDDLRETPDGGVKRFPGDDGSET